MTELGPPKTVKQLICPNCGSDRLALIEDITGIAYGNGYAVCDVQGNEIERAFDYEGTTEIIWDASESRAVQCRNCFWEQDAPNVTPELGELKVADELDR